MPDEVLRALEHRRLRLSLRHPGDALELDDRALPARLLLLLELLQMHLAVADALLAPRDLDQLLVDLRFALRDPLFDLGDLELTVANLVLDVGAQLDGALARLDQRLAPDRLRLALCIRHEPPALVLAAPHRGAARRTQPNAREDCPHSEPDHQRDHREHLNSSRSLGCPRRRRGCSHPASRIAQDFRSAATWL